MIIEIYHCTIQAIITNNPEYIYQLCISRQRIYASEMPVTKTEVVTSPPGMATKMQSEADGDARSETHWSSIGISKPSLTFSITTMVLKLLMCGDSQKNDWVNFS